MRLAVVLREWDVGKIERSITAKRFVDWEAYAQLEPWAFNSELRADYRAASICQTVYNSQVTKKELLKKMEDFRIKFEDDHTAQPKKRQTPEQQLHILKLLSAIHNMAGPAES